MTFLSAAWEPGEKWRRDGRPTDWQPVERTGGAHFRARHEGIGIFGAYKSPPFSRVSEGPLPCSGKLI